MKKYFLTVLGIFCGIAAMTAAEFSQPFKTEAMCFYIIHDGGPLAVTLGAQSSKTAGQILCRVYDADENLLRHEYFRIPAASRRELRHDFGISAPAGIYQVRYSSRNVMTTLATSPRKEFGIMPQRCMLQSTSLEQFADCYFLIPPNAEKLHYMTHGGNVVLTGADGKKIDGDNIAVTKHRNEVWHFAVRLKPEDFYRFGTDGFPVILCPSAAVARRINGSVEKGADGKYYAHKFQLKIVDFLNSITQKDLQLPIVPLKPFAAQIDVDPYGCGFLGPWGLLTNINAILKEQQLDPQANNFGNSSSPAALCAIYALDKKYNPYYLNKVIARRMLIAPLRKFLALRESETWQDNSNGYSGDSALELAPYAMAFGDAGQTLQRHEPALHALWYDAVRRVADRFAMSRVSCENQSSHWPVIFTSLHRGGGSPAFRAMAADYAHGMSRAGGDPFMRTGYQQEAYGPDASYQGLGSCYQALYYRMTSDPEVKETLRIIYDLFNHTVAPEPSGEVFGANNFSHRTKGSWAGRQYGGGNQLMYDVLPEAALLYQAQEKYRAAEWLDRDNERGKIYAASIISNYYSQYKYPGGKKLPAIFPAQYDKPFFRNFNNEFIAVRQNTYYAMLYQGRTSAAWTGASRPKTAGERKGYGKWFQTQGLSLLWFPSYGSLLTAMNWNGDCGAIVRADLPDGRMAYPDYWSLEAESSPGRVRHDSTMFQLPQLNVRRTIEFAPDEVKVRLRLHFAAATKVKALYEQLPLLVKPDMKLEFLHGDKWSDKPGLCEAVRCGAKVEIRFDRAYNCTLGPVSGTAQRILPLCIHFNTAFETDDIAGMSYTIKELTERK